MLGPSEEATEIGLVALYTCGRTDRLTKESPLLERRRSRVGFGSCELPYKWGVSHSHQGITAQRSNSRTRRSPGNLKESGRRQTAQVHVRSRDARHSSMLEPSARRNLLRNAEIPEVEMEVVVEVEVELELELELESCRERGHTLEARACAARRTHKST